MLVARGHAVYCRRDIARVLLTLRVAIELAGRAPHDIELIERAVRGLLPQLAATEMEIPE